MSSLALNAEALYGDLADSVRPLLAADTQLVGIVSGGQWLAERLKEKLGVPEVMVAQIGPIIGSHAGPGTVAVFFLDKDGSARLDAPEAETK